MMDAGDLFDLREALHITQITLAGRLGLSLRALQNIESGRAKLRRVHELAIRAVLVEMAIERGDIELLGSLRSGLTNLIIAEFVARSGASQLAASKPSDTFPVAA